MNIQQALVQLRTDMQTWMRNNLQKKVDKNGTFDYIRLKDVTTGETVVLKTEDGKLVYNNETTT